MRRGARKGRLLQAWSCLLWTVLMAAEAMSPELAKYQERFKATAPSDPTFFYEEMLQGQRFCEGQYVVPPEGDPWETASYPAFPRPGFVRLVCISDTHSKHGKLEKLPLGDVLVHGGDFTLQGKSGEVESFGEWIAAQAHPYKVVIAGNHDMSLDSERCRVGGLYSSTHESIKRGLVETLERNGGVYLEDSAATIKGLVFYGSPWQPEFSDWAFNLGRGAPCLEAWRKIPDAVDVLITHGPPLGRGDLCYDDKRAGCADLLHEIQTRIRPKVHVFGHIHEAYSVSSDGTTDFVNPSTCDLRYKPVQAPIVLDVPVTPGHD